MVLACRLWKVVRLRGERIKYSGDCVVKGLLMRRRAWSGCIMFGSRLRQHDHRRLFYRRLSRSGLRAGGEESRLRLGKLWPWRSRYWGSASCSLRFSLRTETDYTLLLFLSGAKHQLSEQMPALWFQGVPFIKEGPTRRQPAQVVSPKGLHEKLHHTDDHRCVGPLSNHRRRWLLRSTCSFCYRQVGKGKLGGVLIQYGRLAKCCRCSPGRAASWNAMRFWPHRQVKMLGS